MSFLELYLGKTTQNSYLKSQYRIFDERKLNRNIVYYVHKNGNNGNQYREMEKRKNDNVKKIVLEGSFARIRQQR